MRSFIEGFRQEYIIELNKSEKNIEKKQIDCIDLVILRWFVDFYPNANKINVEGVEYAWIYYNKLKDDLPLLDINKRALAERLKKLVYFELLEHTIININGSYTLFRFGKNYKHLIEVDPCSSNDTPCRSNDRGGVVETTTKDSILYNSNKENNIIINNNITKESEKSSRFIKPTIEEIIKYCEERNNNINAEQFYNFYESKGWLVGKTKMKSWKAAIRTWEINNKKNSPNSNINEYNFGNEI